MKKNNTTDKRFGLISKIPILGYAMFAIFWSSISFAVYFNRHTEHWIGLVTHKYIPFLIASLVVIGFASFISYRLQKTHQAKDWINTGVSYLIFSVLFACLAIIFHFFARDEYLPFTGMFLFIGRYLINIAVLGVILFANYAIGRFCLSKVFTQVRPEPLLSIAVGLVIYVFYLFVIGSLGLLNQWMVAIFLLIAVAIRYKNLISDAQSLLVSKYFAKKDASYWHSFLMLSVIFYISINFVSFLAPFPLGFDSRNHYFNIANLIADQHQLLPGFSSYTWSLLMASGISLSGIKDVALSLSFMPVILVGIYMYQIGTRYLKINGTLSLMAVLCFMCTPAVTNHLFIELKVDLGLLFVQLAVLQIILEIFKHKYDQSTDLQISFSRHDKNFQYLLLLSILSGFALSIKFTHCFLIFAVLIALWTYFLDSKGFIVMAATSVLMILILRIDSMSGLDSYHLGRQVTIILLALVTIVSVVLLLRKKNTSSIFLGLSKQALLITFIHLVVISPWMVKNYIDSSSLDPKALLMGKENTLHINMKTLNKNYKKAKRKG